MSYNGRIPVPGFVSSVRKTTYLDRKELQQKRQEEKEKLDKQQKQALEIAKLLNQKWAEEDKRKARSPDTDRRRDRPTRRSRSGDRRRFRENSDDDRPHRGSRDDEDGRGHERRDSGEELRRGGDSSKAEDRQLGRRFREGGADHESSDRAPVEEPPVPATGSLNGPLVLFARSTPPEAPEVGGWSAGEATGSMNRADVRQGEDRKRKATHSDAVAKKFAGVFGMDDSDDEKEKSKAVLAKSKKAAGGQATPSFRPSSGAAGSTAVSTTTSAAPGGVGPSVVAVQMKVAAWKAGLKGKAAIMPIELQQEVAAVMGMANGR